MKIYLASTAPGTEGTEKNQLISIPIPKRLLSYHHIKFNQFGTQIVFNALTTRRNKTK
jgi:hypothetical protein